MGRRPTSLTKGGRFMNPADQQRKVERRKELKRNKRERIQVRTAVLKGKDPEDLLEQMAKWDQMLFDPHNPPPLADAVIRDKHGKLKETYVRVIALHRKEEETDKADHLQKLLREYEQHRSQLEQNYEAVKFANEADPLMIPLPGGDAIPGAAMTPAGPNAAHNLPSHMLLPDSAPREPPQGILKRSSHKSDHPPGPPAGQPPTLSDSDNSGSDDDNDDHERDHKVRFAENVDGEDKDTRTKYKKLAKKPEIEDGDEDHAQSLIDQSMPPVNMPQTPAAARLMHPPPPPMGMPPGFMPPRLPGMFPPPGALGPRPIIPMGQQPTSAAVISAAPTVIHKPKQSDSASNATIQAKPQMRNLRHEVTKLVPTAVRVRREGQVKPKPRQGTAAATGYSASASQSGTPNPAGQSAKPSTDDAYSLFMKEMSGLL